MDGATVRDLAEPGALLVRQRTTEDHLAHDPIQFSFLGLAAFAVLRVDLLVRQTHLDRLERPSLALCIEPHRHRRAGYESDERQGVGSRPGTGAPGRDR